MTPDIPEVVEGGSPPGWGSLLVARELGRPGQDPAVRRRPTLDQTRKEEDEYYGILLIITTEGNLCL